MGLCSTQPGFGKICGEFLLSDGDDLAGVVEDDRTGRGGALVDGENELFGGHECPFGGVVTSLCMPRRSTCAAGGTSQSQQNVTPAAGYDAGEAPVASPAHSLSGEGEEVENGADDGADDRADDGDPGVAPVGAALALDGQDRVGDTGAEVTGRVDGVSGGATERVTDDDDDERDAERADRGLGVDRRRRPTGSGRRCRWPQ